MYRLKNNENTLFTIRELERDWREYVQECIHYGEHYDDFDTYMADFELVEENGN